jgi:hypothetical protein
MCELNCEPDATLKFMLCLLAVCGWLLHAGGASSQPPVPGEGNSSAAWEHVPCILRIVSVLRLVTCRSCLQCSQICTVQEAVGQVHCHLLCSVSYAIVSGLRSAAVIHFTLPTVELAPRR